MTHDPRPETFGYDPGPWARDMFKCLLLHIDEPFEQAWRHALKEAQEKPPHWLRGLALDDRESVSIFETFRDACKRAWKGEGLTLR